MDAVAAIVWALVFCGMFPPSSASPYFTKRLDFLNIILRLVFSLLYFYTQVLKPSSVQKDVSHPKPTRSPKFSFELLWAPIWIGGARFLHLPLLENASLILCARSLFILADFGLLFLRFCRFGFCADFWLEWDISNQLFGLLSVDLRLRPSHLSENGPYTIFYSKGELKKSYIFK